MTKKVSSSKGDGSNNSTGSKWCWMVSVSAFYTVNLSQLSTNKIEHLLACICILFFFYIFALSLAVFLYARGGHTTYAHSNFSRINSIDAVWKETDGRGEKIWVRSEREQPLSDIRKENDREMESTKNEREICLFGGGMRDHLEICYTHTNHASESDTFALLSQFSHNRLIEKWFMAKCAGKVCIEC